MFKSFFPNPKWFFSSLVIWFIINLLLWYSGGKTWGIYFGLPDGYVTAELPINVSRLWSSQFLWFYLWFFLSTVIFAIFWKIKSKNSWQKWSVWGSAFILFNVWFGVQIDVVLNAWYNPFYNLIQKMVSSGGGDLSQLYAEMLTFIYIAMIYVTVAVFK